MMSEFSVIGSINDDEHRYQAAPPAPAATPSVPTSTSVKAGPGKKQRNKRAGAALIGIDVDKEVDMSAWYQQVLLKGDMIEYYDVSGCYIVRPYAWEVWEHLHQWFDKKIKKLGVRNCSFPLFVSEDMLNQEKDHVEGFAAEVAWITRAGKSQLENRVAIRPTSETIMYPYFAKWIRSHRDLPLRLNQWNSVVRWEFKHPQPFLRTREFHWQEGHTAHLTREGANTEVMQILDLYEQLYRTLLAVPVIKGKKTDKEKFAGALYTTTVEGFIPASGRGIQGATSHGLGQNFSKMFGITVEDPSDHASREGPEPGHLHVWQNSWAFSTRVLGVMVMLHGDNKGLVMPPRVAPVQVVLVPVGINRNMTEVDKQSLYTDTHAIADRLRAAGIRVQIDSRDEFSPGYKFNHWELRGVPLRLEFGPEERQKGSITTARRDQPGRGSQSLDTLPEDVESLLEEIHHNLYEAALRKYKSSVKIVETWPDFCAALNEKNVCLIPHCLQEDCEDSIKRHSSRKTDADEDVPEDARAPSMGAKSLCIPFDQPTTIEPDTKGCFNPHCNNMAREWCLFGRSY